MCTAGAQPSPAHAPDQALSLSAQAKHSARTPQEVEAHVCLLALVRVGGTAVAGARHARNQGEVVGVAALGAACAHALHKVVADGATAVLGRHRAVAVGAVEGLRSRGGEGRARRGQGGCCASARPSDGTHAACAAT